MNIYYSSEYNSQASLPSTATFQAITTNSLTIPGANNGDILIADSNHQVDGIAIGPVNYVLRSDGTLPQWTNTITMNTVQTTDLIIPGTVHGDLFTVDNVNTFERVPIGGTNSKLISTGSEYQWGINQFFTAPGSSNNIPQTSAPLASTISMSITSGLRYRLQISGNLITSVPVALSYSLGGTLVDSVTCTGTNPIMISYIFTASSTGPLLITLAGLTGVVTTATLQNIVFALELF